jgi:hypothetical protein
VKNLFILLGLITFTHLCAAHEDTGIVLGPKGELKGLPEQYLPASLQNNKIIIGKHELNMPECVAKYFSNSANYDLLISSSWYHNKSLLPPYINFKIKPKNKDYEFGLLFGLDDLSPIQFTVVTHASQTEFSSHPLELSKQCQTEIRNATK